jgi:acyl carrier protein
VREKVFSGISATDGRGSMGMVELSRLRELLRDTLQIGSKADGLTESSRLFGALPEFDSIAVITVVTAIEQEFGVAIPDRELSADVFETVGSLGRFISRKVESLP